jgi:hypothetical protein
MDGWMGTAMGTVMDGWGGIDGRKGRHRAACRTQMPGAPVNGCNVATSDQCAVATLHAWQGPVMGPVINDVQHAKIWAHIDGAPTPPPPPTPAPPVD